MESEDYKSLGYDVVKTCSRLAGDKSFRNLYSIICSHGNTEAAVWLEGDYPHSMTFSQLAQLTDNYAAVLSKVFGNNGRICICIDLCKEWFPLFWGLIRSGHDVLAVQPSLPDTKVEEIIVNAGAIGIISAQTRDLGCQCRQLLLSELMKAPEVNNYIPVWAHNIAISTININGESEIYVYDEKAVCSHAMFSEKVYKDNRRLIDDKPFRTMAYLPFPHAISLSSIFIWSNFLGYTTIYLKNYDPQTIKRTSKICRVNQIVTVPEFASSQCNALMDSVRTLGIAQKVWFMAKINLSLVLQFLLHGSGQKIAMAMFDNVRKGIFGNDLQSVVIGGSQIDFRTIKVFNAIGYHTACGFGMAETAINSFETSKGLSKRLLRSIGTPMPGVEYRISGKGNKGELQIRGNGIHTGRLVNGEMLPPDLDAEGWFSTRGIAVKDGAGRYHIVGHIGKI